MKEGFLRCQDYGATTHKNAMTLETTFYSPPHLKRRTKKMINFHPFQISVFYSLFLFLFGGGVGGAFISLVF